VGVAQCRRDAGAASCDLDAHGVGHVPHIDEEARHESAGAVQTA